MRDNERGFHNPVSQGHNHNRGGSTGSNVAERFGKEKPEPTNHAGHTHEMARRHEHDARVEGMRARRGGYHDEPGHVTQSKHGADHHIRNEERGESRTTATEEAHEE